MEAFVWLYHLTIPLIGWWLFMSQFSKLAVSLENKWSWGESFPLDFAKSLAVVFAYGAPENLLNSQRLKALPLRLRMLWLGLRSLSFGCLFLLLFVIWNILPPAVVLLLGLVLFVFSQWSKRGVGFAQALLGLGLFLYGFEHLMETSSRLVGSGEDSSAWVYELAQNFFVGALFGFVLGSVLRFILRISGVAWWSGMNLLLSGILSLGGAWGFFLGDFLAGALEDFIRHSQKDFRFRTGISLAFGLVMLLLTTPYQNFVLDWMNGQYSVQLRTFQLAAMIFVFLVLESALALGFFHFYFLKKKAD